MTKDKIKALVDECQYAFLATCDKGWPRVRPMSPFVEDDLTHWIATFAGSRKMAHIKENQRCELCWCSQKQLHARISGSVEVISDVEKKKWLFEKRPDMKDHFKGPDDPNFTLLKLVPDAIEYMGEGSMEYEVYKP